MGRPRNNLIDQRFGSVLVVEVVGRRSQNDKGFYWKCQCDCGNISLVQSGNLLAGKTTSCGCKKTLHGENNPAFVHGMSKTPEHAAYRSARTRCNNPNATGYERYGGRGIKFKFESFERFFKELGKRPSKTYSVDRIDGNGDYAIGNVRWATKLEQVHNRNLKPEYGLSAC